MPDINIEVNTKSIDNINSIISKLIKYVSQVINNDIQKDIIKYLNGTSSAVGSLKVSSNDSKYLEDIKLEVKLFIQKFSNISTLSSFIKPEILLNSKKISIQFNSELLYDELENISREITDRKTSTSNYDNFPELYLQYFTKVGRKSSPKRYSFVSVNGRNEIYSKYGLGYMSEITNGSSRKLSKGSIESINLLEAIISYYFNTESFINKIYSILKQEIVLNKISKTAINYIAKNIKRKK